MDKALDFKKTGEGTVQDFLETDTIFNDLLFICITEKRLLVLFSLIISNGNIMDVSFL